MPFWQRNRPNHSILLVPARLGEEKLLRNKVRVLSVDADGRLFTQLLGRSVYDRVRKEAKKMEMSQKSFATVYLDSGLNRFMPLFVETGSQEAQSLDLILEHALKRGVIPDVLKPYPKEIIKSAEMSYQGFATGKPETVTKAVSETSSAVLNRLPYYEEQDMEVSVPIYKADYRFPLIVLKRFPKDKNSPRGRQNALILDSTGDIGTIELRLAQLTRAERKLNTLHEKGKEGCLVCLRKTGAVAIDILEIGAAQRQALDTLARLVAGNQRGQQPLPPAIRSVLFQAKEKTLY